MAPTTQKEPARREKAGLLDYVSYAAGDFGCVLSFTLAGSYFTIFFTQYMGISSLVFASILAFLKVWDAINDPLIGGVIDSTRRTYKRGKFRTFMFYGSFLLLVSGILCFLPVPQAPEIAKILLCVFGYMLWDAAYTLVNVPYGSLLAVISPDPGDRATLSVSRSIGSMVGSIIAGAVLPMMIYDANSELMGERLFVAALVLGLVGFVAIQFNIATTVERVTPKEPAGEKRGKFNYLKAVKNFVTNRAALGATLPAVGYFLGAYGIMNASQVMFQSYFNNAALSGAVSLCSYAPVLLFSPFIHKIVVRWGKKEAAQAGVLVSIAASLALLVLPIPPDMTGVVMHIAILLIYSLGLGIFNGILYALIADAIDYGEWTTGQRNEGTTYSLYVFFRKLANGLAPSIGLVVMVALGYNEALGAAQPFEVASSLRTMVALGYLLSAVIIWGSLRFVYNVDKKTLATMEEELGKARAAERA